MTTQTSRGLNWLFDSAMPLWAEQGVDTQTGIFFEALDFKGRDVGLPVVRARVQARQIYVFASAHAAGWSGPALELAEAGMFALRAGGWRSDRGWAAQVDRTGAGVQWPGDLYDHAFVLFALARLFEVTGAPEYRRYIDETLAFLDGALRDENGGYREDLDATLPRRQNPHMHLLEAFLALYTATGDDAFLARAEAIFTLFETHFANPDGTGVHEMFDPTWQRQDAPLEPGHGFEWAFLLSWLEFSGGPEDLTRTARALFDDARQSGLSQDGFAVDAIEAGDAIDAGDASDAGGRVSLASRRLWPQTEYLRALQLFAPTEYEAVQMAVFDSYLATQTAGLWHDVYDLDGQMQSVQVPASTLYHLWGGLMPVNEELASLCQTCQTQN